jgi:hypothetical protein
MEKSFVVFVGLRMLQKKELNSILIGKLMFLVKVKFSRRK